MSDQLCPRARTAVSRALAATEDVKPPESSGLATIRVLRSLADGQRAESQALAALCRKLGVAGQVRDRYQSDWARVDEAPPLRVEVVELLAAVLLLHASLCDPDAPDERGAGLKLVNAGLQALDLAGGIDSGDRTELQALARELVENLRAPR